MSNPKNRKGGSRRLERGRLKRALREIRALAITAGGVVRLDDALTSIVVMAETALDPAPRPPHVKPAPTPPLVLSTETVLRLARLDDMVRLGLCSVEYAQQRRGLILAADAPPPSNPTPAPAFLPDERPTFDETLAERRAAYDRAEEVRIFGEASVAESERVAEARAAKIERLEVATSGFAEIKKYPEVPTLEGCATYFPKFPTVISLRPGDYRRDEDPIYLAEDE